MIFQHTWRQVLDGSKTQTRRLVKPEWILTDGAIGPGMVIPTVETKEGWRGRAPVRIKWQVGRTYAVQPGRGQKAVGRIRITDIRREQLQDITEQDAIAEGCKSNLLLVRQSGEWLDEPDRWQSAREVYAELWDEIHTTPGTRWQDNPAVWVLEFELVEASE